jgi:hypothetical protein
MIAGLLVVAVAAAGCGGTEDRRAQVRAACERYVKEWLKQPGAAFSGESVKAESAFRRASMDGLVDSAIRSPAPGGPSGIRSHFTCTVRRDGDHWKLVALTGLPG